MSKRNNRQKEEGTWRWIHGGPMCITHPRYEDPPAVGLDNRFFRRRRLFGHTRNTRSGL